MNTRPSQAIGADGVVSPRFASAIARLPNALSGFDVISEDAAVSGATKQQAVHVNSAAADGLRRGGLIIFVGTPVLMASCWINREYIELRRENQGIVDLDQAAVEACILTCVVGAQNL